MVRPAVSLHLSSLGLQRESRTKDASLNALREAISLFDERLGLRFLRGDGVAPTGGQVSRTDARNSVGLRTRPYYHASLPCCADVNQLRFIFTNVDHNDPQREFSFLLHNSEAGPVQYTSAWATVETLHTCAFYCSEAGGRYPCP